MEPQKARRWVASGLIAPCRLCERSCSRFASLLEPYLPAEFVATLPRNSGARGTDGPQCCLRIFAALLRHSPPSTAAPRDEPRGVSRRAPRYYMPLNEP